MNSTDHILADVLHELLEYSGDTGEFRWKSDRGNNKTAGKLAGCLRSDGYVIIRINSRNYLAHRLAWAMTYGEWPELLDHIDMNPSNNRIDNIRPANHSLNKANRRKTRANTSGFKGVFFDKTASTNPWRAAIKVNYKLKNLGCFASPEEAHAAYDAAARKHFGDFANA
jgi:HNH endonuclease